MLLGAQNWTSGEFGSVPWGTTRPPHLDFEPLFIVFFLRQRNYNRKGEALERRKGEVRGGGSPPTTIIHYHDQNGEALERRTGGVRGGGSPPAQL